MSFAKFFSKSNSSIHQLQGNILDCNIEQIHENKVIINTGLRTPFICYQNELCDVSSVVQSLGRTSVKGPLGRTKSLENTEKPYKDLREAQRVRHWVLAQNWISVDAPRSNLLLYTDERGHPTSLRPCRPSRLTGTVRKGSAFAPTCLVATRHTPLRESLKARSADRSNQMNQLANFYKRSCLIGVEARQRSTLFGEFACSPPKSMEVTNLRKLVWTELAKIWRSNTKNRIKGFILNPVNGGYAVAIAGYIAFLPKSLCQDKKVFLGQWRQFAIISMNPKIANIVVKEIKTSTFLGSARMSEARRTR